MPLTKISPKHQVTIPKKVFESLNLEVGDLLDAQVDNGKIVLTPKRIAEKAPAVKLTPEEQLTLVKVKKKIERIRKDIIHSRGLTLQEARVAAKAGLIAEDQMWWWTEEWQKGEREAESELRDDKIVGPFVNSDELMASLHKGVKHLREKA